MAIRELIDLNTAMNLDTTGLSSDPFYLDSINNDPLAFNKVDSRAMTRELDRAWDRFGPNFKLMRPTWRSMGRPTRWLHQSGAGICRSNRSAGIPGIRADPPLTFSTTSLIAR